MDNELLTALLNVQPGRHGTSPSEHWRTLFNYYNSNRQAGDPHLGMSCQPCYDKVYAFCRQTLLKQLISTTPKNNAVVGKWEVDGDMPVGGYKKLDTKPDQELNA